MIALILIIILCIVYFGLILKNTELAVYNFVPFNYLFDLLFFLIDANLGTVATILRTVLVATFFIRIGGSQFYKVNKPGYSFVIMLTLLLMFSLLIGSLASKSFIETVKFILIMLSFFISFVYFSKNKLNAVYFKRMIVSVSLITIINISLSNIFSFGWGGYSEDVGFFTGGIISNMWYVPALAVLATVAAVNLNKHSSNVWLLVTTIFILLILMVALRRSAYIIIIIAAANAVFFMKVKASLIKVFVGILIILGISAPFFVPYLEKQITARSKTFDKGVEEESRLKETEVLWNERFTDSSMGVLLFGEKPFDSAEQYGGGSFGDRPLHVDMNIVFFSTGLIGLILYVCFYISVLYRYFKISRRLPKNVPLLRIYRYLFFASVLSLIALSFSGGLNAITYRVFGFMLVAISLGQLKYLLEERRKEQRKEKQMAIEHFYETN